MGDATSPSPGATTSVGTSRLATPRTAALPPQQGPLSVSPGSADAPESPPGKRPHGPRTQGFALPSVSWRNLPGGRIALVVAVASFLITGWILAGRQTGQAVHVSVGAVSCTGAKVRPADSNGAAATITPRPGMRCVVPVELTNSGAFSVRVTRVIVPTLGPRGTATVRARQASGGKPSKAESNANAVFAFSERLAPGQSTTVKIVLAYRPGGCTSKGELLLPHFPVLNTRALGVNSRVLPDAPLALAHTTGDACGR
ncbi:MAG: hypothetical protein KDB63_04970 [Nocardioidaceae bacterium]|nr:hypothetical protein [Nocardioidaceae bacterium]